MMKNKHLFSEIPVVLLAFFLVLTACENGTTEVEGTVGISSQEAPAVTAKAVKGGVLLEWNSIVGASYSVWRKAGDAAAILLPYSTGYTVYQDKETGKYRYLDLVSDTNPLTKNTEYTYTVVASGSSKTIGKTEAKATPTDIPEKGSKFDPVKEVTLKLDSDAEMISVSWTAGDVPLWYAVSVYRDGSVYYSNNNISLGETKASFNWPSSSQAEGEYAASVYALSNSYYNKSDPVSAKQEHEALFGSSANPYTDSPQTITDNGTLTGFSVYINFSGIAKPGVSYSVERAPVDAAGTGTYAPVALYASVSDATALTAEALKADDVGTLRSGAYDTRLPTTLAEYKYRVKATKGTVTQTKEIYSPVEVGSYSQYAVSSISIAAATTNSETGDKTYAVTPRVSYKGVLQAGDKLVIYYVKGASSDVAQTGPYTKGPEFSKAELEAASVAAKDLVIPKGINDSYAYVKAYIVLADGTQQNVSNRISSGSSGVSDVYSNYATLNYY
jgi:hypothetical protein